MASERVEQALERLSEDSSLTDELDDQTANVLLQWAEQQVKAAAGLGDNAFSERVAAVRSAARTAARPTTRSGDPDPANVIVQRATELLNVSVQQAPVVASPPVEPPRENAAPAVAATPSVEPVVSSQPETLPSIPTAAPRSPWQLLRRRIRRWTHRKA